MLDANKADQEAIARCKCVTSNKCELASDQALQNTIQTQQETNKRTIQLNESFLTIISNNSCSTLLYLTFKNIVRLFLGCAVRHLLHISAFALECLF